MSRQIPLAFPLRSQATFGNFIVEEDLELVARLQNLAMQKAPQTIWLWGESGVGCSHLLNASCHYLQDSGKRVAYIPSMDWNTESDSLLGYQSFDMVAIDDVHLFVGQKSAEHDLVELYQSLQNTGAIMLLSAHSAPNHLDYLIKDLASRFIAAESYQLLGLSDDGKMRFVQIEAKQRGLELDEGVARFMLTRCSRNLQDLIALLNTLDRESLSQQRKLTVPFLKQVLGL